MILWSFLRCTVVSVVVTWLALVLLPGNILIDIKPEVFTTQPPVLNGTLAINYELDKAERLYDGQIPPPECITAKDGILYTGFPDGRLVKLHNGKVETVMISGGENCDKKPEGCGYPLGMKFDVHGTLVVADAIKGVYKVDVTTGKQTILFDIANPVDGKLAKICNHLDVSRDGDVYFSDVTTKRDIKTSYFEFLEVAPNGRVLHYDPRTGKTKTLVDNVYFANGVQLSQNEDFLVISQSNKYNVLKYHLKGSKKGEVEIFIDNLPGIPDNFHITDRGTFWLALAGTRLPNQIPLLERLGPYPCTRRVFGRLIYIVGSVVNYIAELFPSKGGNIFTVLHDMIEVWKNDISLGPHHGIVLELDQNGNVIRSLHSPSGYLYHPSDAFELEGTLYIGSPFNKVLGKLKL